LTPLVAPGIRPAFYFESERTVLKNSKGTVIVRGVTDEDGWYLLNYKHTGKAANFYVTLTPPGKPGQTQTVTLKANAYFQVDFTCP